jgi:hypothetical protein
MDEFLLDYCFKSCGTQSKFSQLTLGYAILTQRMLHSAEFFLQELPTDSTLCNLTSNENIFNKNSALCCIAGSHDSALCSIAHIRECLLEFEAEFENILGYYSGA